MERFIVSRKREIPVFSGSILRRFFIEKEISASKNLRRGSCLIRLKGYVCPRPEFHLRTMTDFIA